MRHVRFDATKGYHGEGPGSPEEQLQEAMQRALDDAAIATATEDAERQLQEPYCIRRTVGSKTKRFVLEQEAEEDLQAEALQEVVGEQSAADCAAMWAGDNMQEACPENSMVGVVNFFNVDNVAYGKGTMEEVVLEGQRGIIASR